MATCINPSDDGDRLTSISEMGCRKKEGRASGRVQATKLRRLMKELAARVSAFAP